MLVELALALPPRPPRASYAIRVLQARHNPRILVHLGRILVRLGHMP